MFKFPGKYRSIVKINDALADLNNVKKEAKPVTGPTGLRDLFTRGKMAVFARQLRSAVQSPVATLGGMFCCSTLTTAFAQQVTPAATAGNGFGFFVATVGAMTLAHLAKTAFTIFGQNREAARNAERAEQRAVHATRRRTRQFASAVRAAYAPC